MRIAVRVIPRSRRNVLEWEHGNMKAHLTAPPVEGAANEALIALLAERLDVPKRTITIVRGTTGRQKIVDIAGLTPDDLAGKLPPG